jgi:phosphoglycolate phosphatase-like HAD superfamily hydrolase
LIGHEIHAKDSLVIGDTAEDIACARSAGVSVLALGTGCTPIEQLEQLNPDFLLENFSDVDTSVSILLGKKKN